MSHQRSDNRDMNERREDALRPSSYLGYDRDSLAMYLIERGAYKIAEAQFRRAIWLNPFEPKFKTHLAWCFHKQGRHAEARACLAEVSENDIDADTRAIVRIIKRSSSPPPVDASTERSVNLPVDLSIEQPGGSSVGKPVGKDE